MLDIQDPIEARKVIRENLAENGLKLKPLNQMKKFI